MTPHAAISEGEQLEVRFDLIGIEAVQESQSEKAERMGGLVEGDNDGGGGSGGVGVVS